MPFGFVSGRFTRCSGSTWAVQDFGPGMHSHRSRGSRSAADQTVGLTGPGPLAPPRDCPLCPRLAAFREKQRMAHPTWFNAPVPPFGDDQAELLIVGLAPGLKGANGTEPGGRSPATMRVICSTALCENSTLPKGFTMPVAMTAWSFAGRGPPMRSAACLPKTSRNRARSPLAAAFSAPRSPQCPDSASSSPLASSPTTPCLPRFIFVADYSLSRMVDLTSCRRGWRLPTAITALASTSVPENSAW
jgi:hypothetical protein